MLEHGQNRWVSEERLPHMCTGNRKCWPFCMIDHLRSHECRHEVKPQIHILWNSFQSRVFGHKMAYNAYWSYCTCKNYIQIVQQARPTFWCLAPDTCISYDFSPVQETLHTCGQTSPHTVTINSVNINLMFLIFTWLSRLHRNMLDL